MGDCCPRFVVGLVIVFLIAGIGGLAVGGATNYWFTMNQLDTHIGLWEYCTTVTTEKCHSRSDILRFKDTFWAFESGSINGVESNNYDLVLVFLIASGASALLGLITSLSMCCISNKRSTWRCVATPLTIFSFMAAGLAVATVVVSEVLIIRETPSSQRNLIERGWSALITWVAAGALILSFVMSLVTCCTVPTEKYESRTTAYNDSGFNYTPNNRSQQQQPGYSSMPNGGANSIGSRRSSAPKGNGLENAGYQMR